MSTDPSALLRQLGQTSRVSGPTTVQATSSQSGIQAGEFADLLQRARDGTLSSNRPVTIEEGSGLKLDEAQLARLSLAADRAEAAGLRKALVMIDDQRVILDVHQRTVVNAATSEAGVLDGIDGVLDLAGVLTPAAKGTANPGPPSTYDNPAVARLLSQTIERDRAA